MKRSPGFLKIATGSVDRFLYTGLTRRWQKSVWHDLKALAVVAIDLNHEGEKGL